ncbi:MAG: N-acetyl-gamma-glutamyl-phosphate reductase [Xanthomonadaceae bacterium]|nr:N-acetyl-gamma-glutamyl-phosphate reductase [Xanthomonadaceae bacterium]
MKIGIFGASGYTGFELIQWIKRHPQFEVAFATGESSAGLSLSDIYPTVSSSRENIKLISSAEADMGSVELVFFCLSHGSSELPQLVKKCIEKNVRVVDLGGDFRLQNVADYEKWYGHPHPAQSELREFVYGLPELNRAKIKKARLVSNPGCYPTSAALGLLPFSREPGLMGSGSIVIDSKSGMSGAGRKAVVGSLFSEMIENMRPYGIGHSHRHYPEIRQTLTSALGKAPEFVFTPQVIPVDRGILSNIYVPVMGGIDSKKLRSLFSSFFENEKFVRVLPEGKQSQLSYVTRTNLCVISLEVHGGMAIITSCIDNLVKGAAGQAIQNSNLMCGFPEDAGL